MRLFNKIFRRGHHPVLSVIIPYRGGDLTRDRVFKQVLRYYQKGLPEAEVIVSTDPLDAWPFNKSAAINAGVRQSQGSIIAVVDADCYIELETIRQITKELKKDLDNDIRSWYIPYERFYRLNKEATLQVLPELSNKSTIKNLGDPPNPDKLDLTAESHSHGHQYGAMIQIMPRKAFDRVGGWSVMFSGWGSEDEAMLFALDTLYAKHKLFDGAVYHLWHHVNYSIYKYNRTWPGQQNHENNWQLAGLYKRANGNEELMQELCENSFLVELARNESKE